MKAAHQNQDAEEGRRDRRRVPAQRRGLRRLPSAVGRRRDCKEDAKSLGWQVNEQFLRTQLENGVSRIDYLLDHDLYDSLEDMAVERAGSFSQMEVEFLSKHAQAYGYERVGDSWVKVKDE